MTKRELGQIEYLNREIEMWQAELASLRYDGALQSIDWEREGESGGRISDKTAAVAIARADIATTIERLLGEVQQQRKRIIEYISTVEDSQMRQVLFLKHVSCLSWARVAAELGYSDGEALRKRYERYLKAQNAPKITTTTA